MHPAEKLFRRKERLVAGLMSGTSLDAIDCAICRISGSRRDISLDLLAFTSTPISDDLRRALLSNSAPETSSVRDISQLNVLMAHHFADEIRRAADAATIPIPAIDLIGCHGQTIYHMPDPEKCCDRPVASTLQIGDGSTIANLLEIPTVTDFRMADVVRGGQGAPLVPYLDYVLFTSEQETRALLNIGGIANITLLPRSATPEEVRAFDTGPGNMVINAIMEHYFKRSYDHDGEIAASGQISEELLNDLAKDAYLMQEPPKSTGREYYGVQFASSIVTSAEALGLAPEDVVATATLFTAASIHDAYLHFIKPSHVIDALIVSGGGLHNRFLMHHLRRLFAPTVVRPISDYGTDPEAKEAICFAVLAHEFANGVPANLPSVTGASRPALLGKLSVPFGR